MEAKLAIDILFLVVCCWIERPPRIWNYFETESFLAPIQSCPGDTPIIALSIVRVARSFTILEKILLEKILLEKIPHVVNALDREAAKASTSTIFQCVHLYLI